MAHKKLYRDLDHSSIGGVASGLALFFDMDVVIFRVLFVITTLFGGGGLLVYVILWIAVPPKPFGFMSSEELNKDSADNTEPLTDIQKPKKNGAITGGIVLIGLGILLLINIFTDLAFRDIWPVIIIILGVIIVFTGFFNKK